MTTRPFRFPQFCGLGGILLFLLTPPAHARSSHTRSKSNTQAQAFQLGLSLQLPTERALTFLEAAKRLRTVGDDDEGTKRVFALSREAAQMRRANARAYTQAGQLLKSMGAPRVLRSWAEKSATVLGEPVIYSSDAKADAKSDPDAATVLATIDEAQALKADADSEQPALSAWLKLSSGARTTWAADLGAFTARLHLAEGDRRRTLYLSPDASRLRLAAPPTTPLAVREALLSLSPSGGNLASVATINAVPLSSEVLKTAENTLLDAYDARETLQKDSR